MLAHRHGPSLTLSGLRASSSPRNQVPKSFGGPEQDCRGRFRRVRRCGMMHAPRFPARGLTHAPYGSFRLRRDADLPRCRFGPRRPAIARVCWIEWRNSGRRKGTGGRYRAPTLPIQTRHGYRYVDN
jgi:hypothetical protein